MAQKVSIIIPLHNAEPWIEKTLQSSLDQTWQNIEIVVVENGSSDKSFDIAKKFQSDKVQVVSIPKTTAAAARNHGLNLASGDYIQFLDADDLLSSNKIKSQLELISKYSDDCLISCGWGKFTDEPTEASFIPQKVWGDYEPMDWLVSSLSGGGMMQTACWLTSKHLIDRAGSWNEELTLHDDGEFFSRVLLQSKKVIFDANAKVYYRQVQSSLSHQNKSYKAAESALNVALSYKKSILKYDNSAMSKMALANVFKIFIYQYHPNHKSLVKTAIKEMNALNLKTLPNVGGANFIVLSKLFGFKNALHIRQAIPKFRNTN